MFLQTNLQDISYTEHIINVKYRLMLSNSNIRKIKVKSQITYRKPIYKVLHKMHSPVTEKKKKCLLIN